MKNESLVSAEWLQQHIDAVVVLDGSYYLSTMGKDADAEFNEGHIPGAQRWDIDQIADKTSGLKHMMPPASVIAQAAGERGIDQSTMVVVYDQIGMFSAARVWLALKSIGHRQVALLDGGLPAWRGELEEGVSQSVSPLVYGAMKPQINTVQRMQVLAALDDNNKCVLDARAADRFHGRAPEPVAGLKGGHMPGAVNIPFTLLLDENNKFKSIEGLRSVFNEHQVDFDKTIITSCGSGVTASIITFALSLLDVESVVYDGSWSEWAMPELELPIVSS